MLEMHQVINLDTTGLDALETLLDQLHRRGGEMVIAEPTEQPLSLLTRSGFLERMGRHNLFDALDEALVALRERHRGADDDDARTDGSDEGDGGGSEGPSAGAPDAAVPRPAR